MDILGKSLDGRQAIVLMDPAELAELEQAKAQVDRLKCVLLGEPEAKPKATLGKGGRRAARAAKAGKPAGRGKRSRDKVCLVCGYTFRDNSKTNCMKACNKPACREDMKARKNTASARKPAAPAAAPQAPAPAKPVDRVALLKQLNAKLDGAQA